MSELALKMQNERGRAPRPPIVQEAIRRHDLGDFTSEMLAEHYRDYADVWRRYRNSDVDFYDLTFSQRNAVLILEHYLNK